MSIREPDQSNNVQWLLAQEHVGVDDVAQLIPALAVAPDDPRSVEKLRDAISRGVRWLKVHPLIGRSNTLDPSCEGFYRLAEQKHMPIVYHTGGAGWDWPGEHAHPNVCGCIAGLYPELPILMAHCGVFGGADYFEEALICCEKHPNLHLDTTMALLPLGPDRWKAAIARVGVTRVIYGNDYPWCSEDSVRKELEFIHSLGLADEELARILGANFMELHCAAT